MGTARSVRRLAGHRGPTTTTPFAGETERAESTFPFGLVVICTVKPRRARGAQDRHDAKLAVSDAWAKYHRAMRAAVAFVAAAVAVGVLGVACSRAHDDEHGSFPPGHPVSTSKS